MSQPQTESQNQKLGIAIFDLDGCLFDDEHRRHLIKPEGSPDRYKDYHLESYKDEAIPHGIRLVVESVERRVWIAFVTAREVAHHNATITQIGRFMPDLVRGRDYELFMRPDGDLRQSPEFKREVAAELKAYAESHGTSIVGAFDDRHDVLAAYRELGLVAILCNKEGSEATGVRSPEQIAAESKAGASLAKFRAPDPAEERFVDRSIEVPAEKSAPENGAHEPALSPSKYVVADTLERMAATFRERNAEYKDNGVLVGELMKVMFPHGIVLSTTKDQEFFHLFSLMVVKLSRFVKSGLKHVDSIHDAAIYAAMQEQLVGDHNITINEV